jgi:hypothetical protein
MQDRAPLPGKLVPALLLTALLLVERGAAGQRQGQPELEGVYTTCEEVQGFFWEVLELKGGKYRYWVRSDVSTSGEKPAEPCAGDYKLTGKTLTFDHPSLKDSPRTLGELNGVAILWRGDGAKLWEEKKQVHLYGTLIRIRGVEEGPPPHAAIPSIRVLYTKEMVEQEQKEYENRFSDVLPPAKDLLRTYTSKEAGRLAGFRNELRTAREKPEAPLVSQLIQVLPEGFGGPGAKLALETLFLPTWVLPDQPPFVDDPDRLRAAVHTLIAGVSKVRDRKSLQTCLLIFLRLTRVAKMELEIPGAGVAVRLEADLASDGYKDASAGTNEGWKDHLGLISAKCQEWMRASADKLYGKNR